MQFYQFYRVLSKVKAISFKQCTAFRLLRKMSSIDKNILSMAQAEENLLDVGQDIKLWYRTWGNVSKGIPVLFVHGGPGSLGLIYVLHESIQTYHSRLQIPIHMLKVLVESNVNLNTNIFLISRS